MATEALYYQLAGQCAGVTVPAVVAVDGADATGGYLVMTECPGSPWPELTPQPRGGQRDELGGQVARLHTITGPGFGYPSGAVGPLRDTWRAAFLDMVNAVLADAETYAVALPRSIADVLDWFDARASVLDEVTAPALVHFDLWDGNILVELTGAGHRIGGTVTFDFAARQRLSLYRTYLNLIMWVEAVPRQASQERREWLHGRVFQPLIAAFDDGSPP